MVKGLIAGALGLLVRTGGEDEAIAEGELGSANVPAHSGAQGGGDEARGASEADGSAEGAPGSLGAGRHGRRCVC